MGVIVYGLTGGIGMGKTMASSILARLGCNVVDTDDIARTLTQPGQPALTEIRDVFGDDCFDADDRLRRDILAERVFREPASRHRLEAILHPRIRAIWRDQVARWRHEGSSIAVVVIPLLFETNSAEELDRTVCVACSRRVQQQRLIERGWTVEEMERRMKAQMDVRRKLELADYVVWNDSGIDVLEGQLKRVIRH